MTDAVLRPGPVALFGSPTLWQLLQRARAEGRDWYYGDKAYFGRGRFFRCTRNALQHDGLTGNADPSRFERFGIPIRPWRIGGQHIVVICQSPAYFAWFSLELEGWVRGITKAIARHTDRPVRVRWSKKDPRPLAEDLRDAWATVALTSNAAAESVLAGVPVFCLAECAASAMGSNDLASIETPRMPDDRLRWASVLANNQWTLEEMRRGMLWREIGVGAA